MLFSLFLTIFVLICFIVSSATCYEDDDDSATVPRVAQEDSIMARSFVEQYGGYIHPQLFVGIWNNTMRGVGLLLDPSSDQHHAINMIEKGTLLFRIPWSMTADAEDDCDMVRYLSRELQRYQRGEQSMYGKYLNDIVRIQDQYDFLCSSWWSDGGGDGGEQVERQRQLLQGIPPFDFDRHVKWLEHTCGFGNPSGWDKFVRRALLFVVSYATNEGVIPYFDLLNSHRGLHNIRLNLTPNELQVYASRDIQPGDQLWNLYGADLKTSDVWRDYGYVEDWPRRWTFEVEEEVSWLWGWINTTARVKYAFGILPGDHVLFGDQKSEWSGDNTMAKPNDWKGYASSTYPQIPTSKLSSFIHAANLFLAKLPTSIEEDERILSGLEGKERRMSRTIMYRLQYKKDIRFAINAANSLMKKRGAETKGLEL